MSNLFKSDNRIFLLHKEISSFGITQNSIQKMKYFKTKKAISILIKNKNKKLCELLMFARDSLFKDLIFLYEHPDHNLFTEKMKNEKAYILMEGSGKDERNNIVCDSWILLSNGTCLFKRNGAYFDKKFKTYLDEKDELPF